MESTAALRFLADESCDFSVVRALRGSGYDVVAVVERAPAAPDEKVIELARSEQRILLTEGRDFGRLVFASAYASSGVVYIRFPTSRRSQLPHRILDLVQRKGERLAQSFTVIGPARIRMRTSPHPDSPK